MYQLILKIVFGGFRFLHLGIHIVIFLVAYFFHVELLKGILIYIVLLSHTCPRVIKALKALPNISEALETCINSLGCILIYRWDIWQ